MDLLPSEFISYARYAKVSNAKITQIIGHELMNFLPASEEDLVSREIPQNNEIPIKNWKLLEKPTHVFSFKKIARRDVFQAYQLFYEKSNDKLTLVGTNRFNAVLFEAYSSQTNFIKDISEKYEHYERINQDLNAIQQLSSDEFFVFTALLELFTEKYPTPNTDWSPDELLVFTKESLLKIISDSEEKLEDQTWWQHWQKINEIAVPNNDNLETAILLLANKGFVGILDDINGKEVFFIGQSLVWILRSLVWWDLGFVIENEQNKTKLFVLQASALFALIVEDNQNFSLFNIEGAQLPKLLSNFMNDSDEKNTETDSKKLNFCPNCGAPVISEAKFCANCGNKLT